MCQDHEQFLQLKSILMDSFFVREDSIFPEAMLDEGLGLDSLEKVRLFNHLEVELDIEFFDEEVDETECVQDLVDIIGSKQGSKQLAFAL